MYFSKILVMGKIKIITLLVFIFGNNVLAQSNFKPGIIFTIAGDNIQGEIDYRNWEKNPKKISFKNFENKEVLEITPNEIQGFSVAEEVYISARVETEALGKDQLDQSPNIETITETVFLQTLTSGEKSLFLYKNEWSRENFYIKENDEHYLLKYKKYNKEETVGGTKRIFAVENKFFLGQLSAYLNDCPTIQEDISRTQYKSESLIRLFLKYTDCMGKEVQFQKPKEKLLTKFGFLGGVSMTSLNFKGQNRPNLTEVNYGISTNPVLGLSFDLILPRNMRKWSITNELMFASYKFSGSNTNQKSTNHVEQSETRFESSQLKINSMVQHSMFFNSLEWFLHGGVSFGFALSETNEEYIETVFFDSFTAKNRKPVESDRIAETGFLFGTGLRFGNISGIIRYENGNGMSDNPSLLSKTHKLFILIGYRF
jgi:hypothetical protein